MNLVESTSRFDYDFPRTLPLFLDLRWWYSNAFYELARNEAVGEMPSRYSAARTVTKRQCMRSEPKDMLNATVIKLVVLVDHVCLPTLNPSASNRG